MHEAQIRRENIREKCIYDLVEEYNDLDVHIFFNYLYNVRVTCLEPEGQISDKCAKGVMEAIGINEKSIRVCMNECLYDLPGYKQTNILLQEDVNQANKLGITLTPSLTINEKLYTGKLEANDIFRSICRAVPYGHEPIVCDPGYDIEQSLGHKQDFVHASSWTRRHLISICFSISMFTLFLGFLCFKLFERKGRQ